MSEHQIVISEPNARVLRSLLRARRAATHDQVHLDELTGGTGSCTRVGPKPAVTERRHDARGGTSAGSGERATSGADSCESRRSRCERGTHLCARASGHALLGYREGDVVERVMPGGLRRLLIEEVCKRQPPAPNP